MSAVQLDATALNAARAFDLIRVRLKALFALFDAEGVTEVNLNGPGKTFIVKGGERLHIPTDVIDEVTAASAVRELASSMGQESKASDITGIVDAKMPGFRFSAILSPIATAGTAFSIRKHNPQVLALSDYVTNGGIPVEIAEYLSKQVKSGANILIGGSTDSGKTTFLNALSREIPTTERVATIEDTRELKLIVNNWLALETNAQKHVTATLCLKALMRHSPDRIICGELRDGAAADFISSTNTGHHGCMSTVHCGSAALGLERLEDLCLQGASDWPLLVIKRNIGRSINLVAFFEKRDGIRRLVELVEVHGIDLVSQSYQTKTIFQQ